MRKLEVLTYHQRKEVQTKQQKEFKTRSMHDELGLDTSLDPMTMTEEEGLLKSDNLKGINKAFEIELCNQLLEILEDTLDQLSTESKQSIIRSYSKSLLLVLRRNGGDMTPVMDLLDTLATTKELSTFQDLATIYGYKLNRLITIGYFRVSPIDSHGSNASIPLEGDDPTDIVGCIGVAAELLVAVCELEGMFDLSRAEKVTSTKEGAEEVTMTWVVHNIIKFTDDFYVGIKRAGKAPPPMVIKPAYRGMRRGNARRHDRALGALHKITRPFVKGSVRVTYNGHMPKITIDTVALDTAALTPMCIDRHIYSNYEEPMSEKLVTTTDIETWLKRNMEMHKIVSTVLSVGNICYFPHKYDRRGRMYSQGYAVNLQADEYRKALLNIHGETYMDVPKEFQL